MVPNGTAYASFPDFANNGNKTPPGGSTDSAKYAQGMLPADTFPAEWANYLFHGATAGITRLNTDTLSIKEEINTVLASRDETPDATKTNQLLTVLNKIKAEAILAAHPVGSLYWTSSNENPAITFGGGTWVQIKDKFVLAAGDTYTNGATGGSATVTLMSENMPSHSHSFTPSGTVGSHSHGMNHHHNWGSTGYVDYKSQANPQTIWGNGGTDDLGGDSTGGRFNNGTSGSEFGYRKRAYVSISGWTGDSYTTANNWVGRTSTDDTQPSFTGSAGTTGTTGGKNEAGNPTEPFDILPPYTVRYCWERSA